MGAPVKLVYDFPAYALLLGQQQQQQQQQHNQQRQFMEKLQQQADRTLSVQSSIYQAGTGSLSTEDPLEETFDSLIESSLEKLFEQRSNLSTATDLHLLTTSAPGMQVSISVPLSFGERKLIRLPNGHTYHMCNSTSQCEGEHKVCAMSVCVCKPGYYEQSNSCRSIGDLLKDCQDDLQCQAINVDLICDTDSHERPVCDCAEGLYFEPETHRCLPCHRNILIHTSAGATGQRNKTNSQPEGAGSLHSQLPAQIKSNSSQSLDTQSNVANTSQQAADEPLLGTTLTDDQHHYLRPCLPLRDTLWKQYTRPISKSSSVNGSIRLPGQRGFHEHFGTRTLGAVQPASSSQSSATQNLSPQLTQQTTSPYGHSTSDPFRINTPLHVFMGAIMLFTLFTVAWFFLQRMIHDCRAILRSLRNPELHFATTTTTTTGSPGNSTICAADPNIIGTLTGRTAGSHHFFDPTSQAVARLIASDSVYGGTQTFGGGLSPGVFQRDLAGVMVQHLAANLTPSSTSNTLVGANGSTRTLSPGLGPSSEHEAALYSFGPPTGATAQSRHVAAAAAAQLLLSPTHPAIAILRAAAASAAHNQCHGADFTSANLLSSILDPPPKYEEAVAYSNRIPYSANPIDAINEQTSANSTTTGADQDSSLPRTDLDAASGQFASDLAGTNLEVFVPSDSGRLNCTDLVVVAAEPEQTHQAVTSTSSSPAISERTINRNLSMDQIRGCSHEEHIELSNDTSSASRDAGRGSLRESRSSSMRSFNRSHH